MMDPVRTLSQAVGAWLQYEFACGRSMLFNERYLSVPIATALHALFAGDVHSEYLHPVLAPAKTGPGRRPEVDFAIVKAFPKVSVVVESKWIGPLGISAADLLWDLLRLELIAHHAEARAFFLLAGRRKHLEKFFHSKAFMGAMTSRGKYRRLLKLDARKNARIRVDNPAADRANVFRDLFEKYQSVSFTSRVTTSLCHKYPLDCPTFQYQAYAWEVIAPADTTRFKPENHALYRSSPAVAAKPIEAAHP